MTNAVVRHHFSEWLVSRKGARIALGSVAVLFLVLFGLLRGVAAPSGNATVPAGSESARAAELLAAFPDADRRSLIVVAQRDDSTPLTAGDAAALHRLVSVLDEHTGLAAAKPHISDDGRAAAIVTPVTVGADNAETAEIVEDLRAAVSSAAPAGLRVWVTGGPAFGADITSAFDGANVTLLAVTILIVAALLILTYRSPILWLIPLAVVALADRLAAQVTAAVGSALGLQFDAGIISVLVFGAGTNYSLLLISRYREELSTTADHRMALATAWRGTVPALVASNVTVVMSLLSLVLAVIPGTHGLGVASAVGLLIALASVLLALPPALAVCGRKIFWPLIPRPGSGVRHGRVWHAVASTVMRRPGSALVAGLAVLAVMATGLIGTTVGLSQQDKFRGGSESAAGLTVLSEHFDAGEAQPILVVAASTHTEQVLAVARQTDGVLRAQVDSSTSTTVEAAAGTTDGSAAGGTVGRHWSKIVVTGEYAPGTPESLALVTELRAELHAVPGADALVGGPIAETVDARAGNQRDLWLIAPLILAVGLLVLWLLLRSLVAPFVLVAANLVSATAAIGAGAWLSRLIFEKPALDLQVPLISFLFLVALGIDYTIFLVHRASSEARRHGTREGMVRAVTHTGGVITSAGIVLAGVFAALGVLPLVTLGQLGIIVGLGVIVDTVLVRTVLVPALFALIGDRIWWPRRPTGATIRRETINV